MQSPGFAIAQAQQLAAESARYNVAPSRTYNQPLVAIAMLQRRYRHRFEFSLHGTDEKVGKDVWVMRYVERARPTVLRRYDGVEKDLPMHGRFWVNGSGTIVRNEMVAGGADEITVVFAPDDQLKIAVPAEMHENYSIGAATASGKATYSRFRRFAVTTDEQLRRSVQ